MEFSYGEVNAGALCTEIVESMRLRNPQGVTLSLAEGLPECHFIGDRARITQVLTNFITNAQKFTEQGHIRLGYAVREDDTVRFYVEDTGIGIEAERQEEIFNRFIKLDSFKQGTGLGLPICKNLVERMGGSIGVDSRRGEGSCFWFTLPYRNGLLEAPEERESPPPRFLSDPGRLMCVRSHVLIAGSRAGVFFVGFYRPGPSARAGYPTSVATIVRAPAWRRNSQSQIPCQRPRSRRPPVTGMVREAPASVDLKWAGMSSSPSSVWR